MTTPGLSPTFNRCVQIPAAERFKVQGGRQTMMLAASIPIECDGQAVTCDFSLTQGQTATFVLAYGNGRPASVERYRTAQRLEETRRYWLALVSKMDYQGLWRDDDSSFIPRASPDDVPAQRSYRCRAHHQPAGNHWRFPQLGLPVFLAARRQFHRRHSLSHGGRLRRRPVS